VSQSGEGGCPEWSANAASLRNKAVRSRLFCVPNRWRARSDLARGDHLPQSSAAARFRAIHSRVFILPAVIERGALRAAGHFNPTCRTRCNVGRTYPASRCGLSTIVKYPWGNPKETRRHRSDRPGLS
jgi:hypothetical protein